MEMGDLISRKEFLEAIDERERIARKYVPDIQDDELRPTLKSLREFVNKRPAVDAEPVRHSKWVCRTPGVFSAARAWGWRLVIGRRAIAPTAGRGWTEVTDLCATAHQWRRTLRRRGRSMD